MLFWSLCEEKNIVCSKKDDAKKRQVKKKGERQAYKEDGHLFLEFQSKKYTVTSYFGNTLLNLNHTSVSLSNKFWKMAKRNVRWRMLANEGLRLAKAAIPVNTVHIGQVSNHHWAILRCGVVISLNLVQKPMQHENFCATFDLIIGCILISQMIKGTSQLLCNPMMKIRSLL